jgi:succinate dehydrogenase / fumarate reductase membrane anchor subunit
MSDTTKSAKPMQSEMARVRGLGAAKEGVQHWWMQRLTAVALIPLGIWFVASVVGLAGADHAAISLWLGAPFTLGALSLLLLATLYHAVLGLQVVIEDYEHTEAIKLAAIILLKLVAFVLAAVAIVSLLMVAFQG